MTTNLKTRELVEAAITALNGAVGTTITFAPKIIQEGDLFFYVESSTLTDDLPAIFVRAQEVAVDIGGGTQLSDVGGHLIGSITNIRMVAVSSWDHGDEVVDKQINIAEEIAQVFIGSAGDAYDLVGASISGYLLVHALVTSMELNPPESSAVSFFEERQLFAVAVTLQVHGRSARV